MFKSILLPLDLAHPQDWDNAIDNIKALAGEGAELHVLSVVPNLGTSVVSSFFPDDFEKKATTEVKAKLKTFLEERRIPGVTVHGHVAHGTIYEQILAAADKMSVDLIVVSAHRPDLSEYLLGPNAARVVRHARQSVLVIRT